MITRRKLLQGAVLTAISAPFLTFQAKAATTVKVRRDVTKMHPDDPFFAKYALAIKKMHKLPDTDPRNWRNQAIIHVQHCPHGMADFLEWHRFYITYFESICAEMIGDANFALPYWNWSNNQGLIPKPFFGKNSLNVEFLEDESNYTPVEPTRSDWGIITTVGTRNLTATKGLASDPRFSEIFSEQVINDIKSLTSYDQFHRQLEGSPHNTGHVLTGEQNGHMVDGLSSLDPIFWLHHCNVDRIWAEWQAAGNITTDNPMVYDQQFFDATGKAVNVKATDTHDYNALGFTYDSLDTLPMSMFNVNFPENKALSTNLSTEKKLGSIKNTEVSSVNVVTQLRVKTPELIENLFQNRHFKATNFLSHPRTAIEASRILAILKNVSYPKEDKTRIIVNVFINCPYLTPEIPSTDKHYAGSFAFFGQPMKDMKMGGEFIIDITDAVRYLTNEGLLLQESELNIQLMPLVINDNSPKDAKFKVGSVEILRV